MRKITWVIFISILIPIVSHATILPYDPCQSASLAKDKALSELSDAQKGLNLRNKLLSQAMAAVSKAENALTKSIGNLQTAEQAYGKAQTRVAQCRARTPKGPCRAERNAETIARNKLGEARRDNMKAFQKWTKALSDLATAEAKVQEATDEVQKTLKAYEKAAAALDKCRDEESKPRIS